MRENFLLFLSLVIGLLFTAWGAWAVLSRLRARREGNYHPISFWISGIILFIGLADLLKAVRDILQHLK